MKGIVYKFTTPNNKVYIGITTRPEKRYKEHQTKRTETLFQRAIDKYGFSNLTYEVLEEYDLPKKELWEVLCDREQYYISKFQSNDTKYGYNLTQGGEGALGYKFSAADRLDRSIRFSGENNPMYGVENPFKGKTHSQESRRKMSEWHSNKTLTEEHKRKIALANTNKKHAKESILKMREVQTKLHGKAVRDIDTGEVFSSVSAAARAIGSGTSDISKVCKGQRKTVKGHRFEYVNSTDEDNTVPS